MDVHLCIVLACSLFLASRIRPEPIGAVAGVTSPHEGGEKKKIIQVSRWKSISASSSHAVSFLASRIHPEPIGAAKRSAHQQRVCCVDSYTCTTGPISLLIDSRWIAVGPNTQCATFPTSIALPFIQILKFIHAFHEPISTFHGCPNVWCPLISSITVHSQYTFTQLSTGPNRTTTTVPPGSFLVAPNTWAALVKHTNYCLGFNFRLCAASTFKCGWHTQCHGHSVHGMFLTMCGHRYLPGIWTM